MTTYGSDLPRATPPPPPPPPPAPTITTSASAGPLPPGTAVAASYGGTPSSASMSPGALATSGVAATGTGAAIVSSQSKDELLDMAVHQAYELMYASRGSAGIHWCVGIFTTATGTESIITSNDGASYIPPGVFLPNDIHVLFADPLLDNGFQAKWFGWINPAATMVAYAAHRGILDPNCVLHALAATTDPRGSSVLPARQAGVAHYQDCDAAHSPIAANDPQPELDDTRVHRLAAIDPAAYHKLTDDPDKRNAAWHATATAVGMAMAGAEPLRIEVAPVIREVFGALAAGTPISESQWTALAALQRQRASLWMRPGYLDMQPSTTSTLTTLYRAQHNIDRATEALALWRSETPEYADIAYAAMQVMKEAQLWPTATSS